MMNATNYVGLNIKDTSNMPFCHLQLLGSDVIALPIYCTE